MWYLSVYFISFTIVQFKGIQKEKRKTLKINNLVSLVMGKILGLKILICHFAPSRMQMFNWHCTGVL